MYALSQRLQLSEEGRGVASIANMLTITRIHNSVAAAAAMRRQTDTPTNYYCYVYITVRLNDETGSGQIMSV